MRVTLLVVGLLALMRCAHSLTFLPLPLAGPLKILGGALPARMPGRSGEAVIIELGTCCWRLGQRALFPAAAAEAALHRPPTGLSAPSSRHDCLPLAQLACRTQRRRAPPPAPPPAHPSPPLPPCSAVVFADGDEVKIETSTTEPPKVQLPDNCGTLGEAEAALCCAAKVRRGPWQPACVCLRGRSRSVVPHPFP